MFLTLKKNSKVLSWLNHNKNFILQHNLTTGVRCYKTFFSRNLRIFVISWSVCTWKSLSSLFYCLRVRPEPTRAKNLSLPHSRVGPRSLPTNIRLDWKGLPVTNTLAFYKNDKLHPYKVLLYLAQVSNPLNLVGEVSVRANIFCPWKIILIQVWYLRERTEYTRVHNEAYAIWVGPLFKPSIIF